MSEWKAKRFWKETAVMEAEGGYSIALDGRPVRTPSKAMLTMPTRAMAEAAAREWDAQTDVIDPRTMPVTRAVNTAIDRVVPEFEAVAEIISEYGATDLLCYRADAPDELVQRQSDQWDPLLDWADEALGARLKPVEGVMHVEQDRAALERLAEQVRALDAYRLTAFHDLVSLSGSLILGFAVTEKARSPDEAWQISRIDENWQLEQWGDDEEAAAMAEAKRLTFLDAARFFQLSETD
ncbi:ATP12 family chaperone protein [Pelagovum pacificum]|uniref:ATPase n=1 Tax=Pelagovum pacificum TaxID=2588711 RepID=A0A5C5GFI4_9RHOB|nr:ATP12 family protein [Pelagovum pacificum]QQA43359.1 ATPase [Pelagovum pacificum]TNY33505.1 ATPase [Pelagovum pacificum]